ncbi:MAG: CDP-diacylglycerol--serine O-phosphatidyltransferase [Bacteroides sp.]|nr:CDP-diacylglycerol--serine O-phosphatidyltransferase [Bacteroides sp.]
MANSITRHLPNTLTCLNLFCGCMASVMAFRLNYDYALLFIIFSAVFDFFDGMAARTLNAYSLIGKDLDSLADDVSFGVAPSVIVFSLLTEMNYPSGWGSAAVWLPYAAFLISVFSALRLAKFNNDTRQTTSFIGLPVPANALFWASLVAGSHDWLLASVHPLWLVAGVCLFSWLLVSEIPMFSLKFKHWTWKENRVSYSFLLLCIPLLVFLKTVGFAAVIVWYILLSLFTQKRK